MEILDLYLDLVLGQVEDGRRALGSYTSTQALSEAAQSVSDTVAHLEDVASRLGDDSNEWRGCLEDLADRLLIEAAMLEYSADLVALGEEASGARPAA